MEINLTDIIIAVIGIVFTGVIIPLGQAFFSWIKTKTQNEGIRAALDEASRIADQVVLGLKQSVVDGLKEKNADGKLTPEEIKDIADMALFQFTNDISQRTYELLEKNTDDIEAFIRNLIESRVTATRFFS